MNILSELNDKIDTTFQVFYKANRGFKTSMLYIPISLLVKRSALLSTTL